VGKLSTYQYDAQANRPDPLSWSLLVKPAGMKIDGATGVVTWTHNNVTGGHSVSIQVQKGAETATQDFKVTVVSGTLNGLTPAELHAGLDRLPALARHRLPGPRAPASRRLERYVVGCARELAPGWRDGPCDPACQERVSACVLARVNALGRSIPVVLGPPARAAEGAFFGNLFSEPPRLFSCGGDRAPPRALGRECALPGNRCGVTWTGPCSAVCAVDARRIARCGRHTHILAVRAAPPVPVP
jgi:hypothetical protein